MGCPLGFAAEAAWRAWVCPFEGQVWRWCSCLNCGGSGSTRYSGVLAAMAEGNIVFQKGIANSIGQYTPVFLPGEPRPDREPWQATIYRVAKRHKWNDPVCIDTRLLPVAALPQWGLSMKVAQMLGLWGLWWHQGCGDIGRLRCRSYGPIRVCFWASYSSYSECLFGQSFSVAPPFQYTEGSLAWGPFLLFSTLGT